MKPIAIIIGCFLFGWGVAYADDPIKTRIPSSDKEVFVEEESCWDISVLRVEVGSRGSIRIHSKNGEKEEIQYDLLKSINNPMTASLIVEAYRSGKPLRVKLSNGGKIAALGLGETPCKEILEAH